MMALARTIALCGAALLPLLWTVSASAQYWPDYNRHSDRYDPGPYNDYWFDDDYAEDPEDYYAESYGEYEDHLYDEIGVDRETVGDPDMFGEFTAAPPFFDNYYEEDWYSDEAGDPESAAKPEFAFDDWYYDGYDEWANDRWYGRDDLDARPLRSALPVGPSRDWYSDQFGYPPRPYVEQQDSPYGDDPWLYDDFTYDEPYKHRVGYYDDGFYDDDWFFDYYDFGFDYGW